MSPSSGVSAGITAGMRFRSAMSEEFPLQIPGVINAYCALMAQAHGFRALYLSGAGVANADFGMPDLGMTNSTDVTATIERVVSITQLPLLVDADIGWGSALNIARTVKSFIRAGAAALHLEDQEGIKRCGHRPNKMIVAITEMVDRIHAAVDAKTDPAFVIIARTDALATEGLEATIERSQKYIEAGADVIFAEAVTTLEQYRSFCSRLSVPVLANMTEFGQSPLLTLDQLREVGIGLVLYPLSAFRAMNAAANKVLATIRQQGTQASLLAQMQTREELYQFLNYYQYEQLIDQINRKGKK
jgi:methylisocitrate lyase